MEEIFTLLEEEKTQTAIDRIFELLGMEENDDFIETLINSLNRISAEYKGVIKAIYAQLLKLIGIENDVLRYSLVLSLKTLFEQDPLLIVSLAKEYLTSENANTRESIVQLLSFAANAHPNEVKILFLDNPPAKTPAGFMIKQGDYEWKEFLDTSIELIAKSIVPEDVIGEPVMVNSEEPLSAIATEVTVPVPTPEMKFAFVILRSAVAELS